MFKKNSNPTFYGMKSSVRFFLMVLGSPTLGQPLILCPKKQLVLSAKGAGKVRQDRLAKDKNHGGAKEPELA